MAIYKTFDTLIQDVVRRVSQVSGTSVQLFAEDRIGDMIQHKFDVLYKDAFWPQFKKHADWTLDGTTGIVTTDLTTVVEEYSDFQALYPDDLPNPLTQLPEHINPTNLTGTKALFVEPTNIAASKFVVWPKLSTGSIHAVYRLKPAAFAGVVTVDFDPQVLVLGAAWDYLEDDGDNPGAAEKLRQFFEDRRTKLISELTQGARIARNSRSVHTPSAWFQP